MSILDIWPFSYKPRTNQIKALEWLEQQDSKYLLIEAPVGSGKSYLGITYSLYLDSILKQTPQQGSFILTPQRILQEQYENVFQNNPLINSASLYGKSNYSCLPKKTTCEIGSIVKPKCSDCPHTKAKMKAQKANAVVLNYKLALTSFAYTTTFKKRNLIVFDECHTLEDHLVDFDAVRFTEWRCTKYQIPFQLHKTIPLVLTWVTTTYLPKLIDVAKKLEYEIEPLFDKAGTDLTRSEINKIREYNGLQEHIDETHQLILTPIGEIEKEYVLVWDKSSMQFKRLTGQYSFHKYVTPFADKFLFMSSTILDKDGFCEDLGIPPNETSFISLNSEFPPENRPVFFIPQMKVNYQWNAPERKNERVKLLNSIKQVLEIHNNDTGIIHTGNFEIAKWLTQELATNTTHQIYQHNPDVGDDRNAVINGFIGDSRPSVLISPSSTEGLDLKDDLGRFAIFVKVPYGNLGDQWIKRRMDLSNRWYQRKALINIIQGGGRVVRSEHDWGVVYILDGSWNFLYASAVGMIPKWWKESHVRLNSFKDLA